MLVSIEPARAGVDLQTFECAVCNVLETLAAYDDPMKSKGLGTLASRRFAPTEVRCAGAYSAERMANDDGRDELPDGGWDQVIRWAHEDRMIGRASNRHCPGVRGTVKPLAHHTL
jgi:hypothetical protein